MKSLIQQRKRPAEVQEVREPGWDDLVDEFFNPFSLFRQDLDMFKPLEGFIPRVDIREQDHEMTVTAELPGLSEKEVKVELEDHAVILSGEKKEESQEKTRTGYRTERRYGSFHRVIPLPAKGDAEKAKAEFRKGVLTVTVPKMEEPKKHVEIKID